MNIAFVDDVLPTEVPPAVMPESMPDSVDRVADARQRREGILRERFAAAGLTYPPEEMFVRVFKQEGLLELWARSADAPTPLRLVASYPIQRGSGKLGPKRREGDRQIPEGFYTVDRFNPRSSSHLSLGLDYPNASDRIFAFDPQRPGCDIFIHGGAESAGCMAMGDTAVEEIYLAASDARSAGQTTAVHIFPCRMTPANWQTLLQPRSATEPGLAEFWHSLQLAFDDFERCRRVPNIGVGQDGRYRFVVRGD